MDPIQVIANGSTLSFNGQSLEVARINPEETPQEIDCTSLGSQHHVVGVGLPDPRVEASVLGFDGSIAIGQTGVLTITPAGGSPDNLGVSLWVLVGRRFEGITVDGQMVSTLTFRPTEN